MTEARFDFCWICGGKFAQPWPTGGDTVAVDCGACGPYQISLSKYFSQFPLPDSERYRLSYWNKQRQLEGRDPVRIDSATVDSILAALPNPATHTKPDLLLLSLARRFPRPGERFEIDGDRQYSLACARNREELAYFLLGLVERGDLYNQSGTRAYMIKQRGWETASRLFDQPEASKVGFVVMRFSDDMFAIWASAFAPAIKRAGFDPHLANDPAHNDRIDARIITEIKQCRFVVADVTWARPNAYFEAGYALGLGRPVIWTCREDRVDTDAHFDTRQYNYIRWTEPAKLQDELYYRIVSTI